MFGSNPFGQSSSSPFGSQPAFGQNNNASNNPFAPKPFGNTSPFGSQSGGSIFGGMSTGVFGAQSSQPLGSTSVFGASSSPAFGSSAPAFGATSGSSVFGQKPTFGGFGSSTAQTSPFGGGSFQQQSQPAFGSNLFGSTTPFGAPSQPSFGSSSSPAFGAQSASAFGGTSAFGSTPNPTFGSTSGGFGMSSSPFGSNTPAFGASSSSAFGASSSPAFGASSTPAFGASSTPAFGATSTTAFGASSAPAFGASSAPAFGSSTTPFNFGSSPAFGQSTPAFGSSPFGTTSSFGVQSASFGAQTTTPAFGQSAFGGQRGGSRVSPYSPTPETDGATGTQPGKLESISAMQVYKDKSHEELRWEDYQLGDKGGPAPASQSTAAVGFGSSGIGASATPAFGQSSANPFSSTTSPNPFAPKTPAFNNPGFGSSSTPAFGSSPFGTSNTSNLFGSTSSATSSLFGSTPQAFGANTTSPSLFSSSTSAFGSPSLFGPASAQSSGLNFGNSQSSPLFQSSTPALTQSSPFGQTTSTFGQTASGFGQSNLFSTPSSGFGGNLFSTSSSLLSNSNPSAFGQTTPNLATPFQSAQPAQSSGGFSFSNFGQSQAAGTSGFGGTPGMFGQSAFGQPSGSQNIMAAQAAPITNPFGTLPAMPQMSIGRAGNSPSIQYGISSLPASIEEPSNADAIVADEIAKVACSPERTATKSPSADANLRGLGGSTNPVISPLVEQDILNVYEDMGTTERPYVIGEQPVDENRAPLLKSPNEPNNPSIEITSVGAIPHYEVNLTTFENSTDLSATARQTFESDPEPQTNQPIQSPLINTQQIVSIGADIQVQKGFPNVLDDPSLIDERSLRVQIEEIGSSKIGRSGGVSHSALIPASTEPDGVSWNLGLGTILPGEIEKLKDLSPLQLVQSSFKHMELAKHQIAQLGIQNEDVLFDRSITNTKMDNIVVAHRALIVDVESLRAENGKLLKLNADIATEKERILKEKSALFLVIKNMEDDFKKQIEKAKKSEFNDGFAHGYKQRTQEIVTYLGKTTSPDHNLEL